MSQGYSRSVLIIDDNDDDLFFIVHSFRKLHVINEIVTRTSGHDGLLYLRDADPLPVLVLLDLKMPKMDGVEVLRAIRGNERTRTLPIVVFAGSERRDDIVESYAAGVSAYLPKPLDKAAFDDVIGTLGLYWLITDYLPGGTK